MSNLKILGGVILGIFIFILFWKLIHFFLSLGIIVFFGIIIYFLIKHRNKRENVKKGNKAKYW
jgi:heme/copper-type cytochrome/quinol oxidase subunit 2